MTRMKRWLSLVLAVIMVAGMLPASAIAVLATEDSTVVVQETQPEETQPEETQPEETQPEETQPEETQSEGKSEHISFGGSEGLSEEEYAAKKKSFGESLAKDSSTFAISQVGHKLRNEYIEFAVNASDGKFTVGTTGGNPDVASDNNKIMLYGHDDPWSSYTTIRVGNSNYTYGDDGFTTSPYFIGNSNISEAEYGNIRVKQVISIVPNNSTMREDVVEIKYVVTNTGSNTQPFGLRILLDTMLGNNDAAPFRIPGEGDVTTEMEFTGSEIPQHWQAFDSLADPKVVSYGNFLSGSIRPNKVQFANWGRMYDKPWGYSVRTGNNNGDSAVSVIWERNLAPGATETYVTRYGLSELLQNLLPPLGLTISSDASVMIDEDNKEYLPYTITAYIENLGTVKAPNALCKIDLPYYLDYADPDEDGVFPLGDIPGRALITFTKDVIVKNPPQEEVTAQYSVRVVSDIAESKIIKRNVTIEPLDDIDYHDTYDELTKLDYLAFARIAYENFVVGKTVKESLGDKWDSVFGEESITYGELCKYIAKWKVCRVIENRLTGFYAVAFVNKNGESVLAYRGSIPPGQWGEDVYDALLDWAVNDLPMILGNLSMPGNQFNDAIRAYNDALSVGAVNEVRVTGHSLGGLWGDVASAYSGCQGITFNAITGLDVIYDKHPDKMGKNFKGMDKWNFVDQANEFDALAGRTEVILEFFNRLKPYDVIESNYSAARIGANHGLESLVSRGSDGEPRLNTNLRGWRPTSAESKNMDYVYGLLSAGCSLDLGTSGNDFFFKALNATFSNTSYGGSGSDEIYGSINTDSLVGGNGSDILDGGWHDDEYYYFKGDGLDYIYDASGDDKLHLMGFSSSDVIKAESEKNSDFVDITCNGSTIVKIYKNSRAYLIGTTSSFKVHKENGNTIDITEYFKFFNYDSRILFQCPVSIEVLDTNGNVVYTLKDGDVGAHYTQYGNFYIFEEEGGGYGKVLDLVAGYTARVVGEEEGTMAIDYRPVGETGLDEAMNFVDVPITENFTATFETTQEEELILAADTDGDQQVDVKIGYDGKIIPVEEINLDREYLLLRPGESARVQAEVKPAELTDFLQWSVEPGSENIVSVDANGNIVALNAGTGYVVATVNSGTNVLTARCRVDISGDPIKIEGVVLGSSKVTTELYKNDYASFDVMLLLPQNYTMSADKPQNNGMAVEKAVFTDAAMAEWFELVVEDDRTLLVIPTEYARENAKSLKSSYSGTVTVTVLGQDYVTDKLTLTVKKSKPSVKASVASFNSFFSGQTREIKITGVTPTGIYANPDKGTAAIPQWLTLEDGVLKLNENAPTKSVSGTVYLTVESQEWCTPVNVSVTAKNVFGSPSLKLSKTSITMAKPADASQGVELKLQCKNKGDTLQKLNVSGIQAPEGYKVEDFNDRSGSFILKPDENFKAGTVNLKVTFHNTEVTVPLSVKVSTAEVKLKLSAKSLTLNMAAGDAAQVAVTATPADYKIDALNLTVVDAEGNDALEEGTLMASYADGKILVSTTDDTPENTNYTLKVSTEDSGIVTLPIKTVFAVPSVTYKASGALDLGLPNKWIEIKPTFKNYNSGIVTYDFSVSELKGKKVVNQNVTDAFEMNMTEDKKLVIRCLDETMSTGNTYKLRLKVYLESGGSCENTVTLKAKRTAVKLKLSPSSLTLNKKLGEMADVTVSCTNKDYVSREPVWELKDKKGKKSAEGKLDIAWDEDKLTVGVNDNTEYGVSYKLYVRDSAKAPATTMTITIPTLAKSHTTTSLKVSGSLDVIRDTTSITVTPTYQNCPADADKQEMLVITSSKDKYKDSVNYLFNIEPNGQGGYTITRAPGQKIDHSLKYKVKLVSMIDGSTEVESAAVPMTVKMGAAKLSLKIGNNTLFTQDKNSRAEFRFSSTDTELNNVTAVIIKDSKYRSMFEVLEYGNGQFGITFKDGKVSSKLLGKNAPKSVTLSLQLLVDGNVGKKYNATVSLKVNLSQATAAKKVKILRDGIDISGTTLYLAPGDVIWLTAESTPANAMDQFQWSSSNSNVAHVSENGRVSVISTGKAKIVCKAADGSGKQATITLEVR